MNKLHTLARLNLAINMSFCYMGDHNSLMSEKTSMQSRISSLRHRVLKPSFTTTTTIDDVQRISAVTSALEFNATMPSHQPWSLIQIPIAAMFSTDNNESS
ncbi:predicted protein [Arabidopsis lyrata subsp. lyrata]|uniref:Predicted protein n=1 Tax=Arabidopsis lyrata subsp. lyrata TaxID=81972 RepID=D7MV60_ARALL|nr:predicted protein [Arabidopsis lyrata subsp. lyrata]